MNGVSPGDIVTMKALRGFVTCVHSDKYCVDWMDPTLRLHNQGCRAGTCWYGYHETGFMKFHTPALTIDTPKDVDKLMADVKEYCVWVRETLR